MSKLTFVREEKVILVNKKKIEKDQPPILLFVKFVPHKFNILEIVLLSCLRNILKSWQTVPMTTYDSYTLYNIHHTQILNKTKNWCRYFW